MLIILSVHISCPCYAQVVRFFYSKVVLVSRRMDITPRMKFAARAALSKAIRDGVLIRQNCIRCDNPKADGHHPDYTKPLEVIWLCSQCHAREHQLLRLQQRPAKEPKPKPKIRQARPRLALCGNPIEPLILAGKRNADIARQLGVSPERVRQVRIRMRERGAEC